MQPRPGTEGTRERAPLDWAILQMNLGHALAMLSDRESGTARLEEAVKAFQAALDLFEAEGTTQYADLARGNLESTTAVLDQRRGP